MKQGCCILELTELREKLVLSIVSRGDYVLSEGDPLLFHRDRLFKSRCFGSFIEQVYVDMEKNSIKEQLCFKLKQLRRLTDTTEFHKELNPQSHHCCKSYLFKQ